MFAQKSHVINGITMTDQAPLPANSHPGLHLKRVLDEKGWAQSDLTFILGCNPKAVNQIINEKQGVSPAMSKALGEALGMPAGYFAELQSAYDLAHANDPDPAVSFRAQLQAYPIRDMIRRGWLAEGDADDLSHQLAHFFEVPDLAQIPHISHAAKKTSYDETPPAQLAWLYRVRQIAKGTSVPKFSRSALQNALPKLRDLLIAPEEARHVPRILAECGVHFIMVEGLPQSKIDGVCFWVDDSPVIGMSTRYDRIDNFWFVLRHEIEHVLQGHGKDQPILDDLDGDKSGTDNVPEEERVANEAAANFCVPNDKVESFIKRKQPFFYEKDVLAFSQINGIHPGLMVGQMQHKLRKYEYLRRHQVKVRQFVAPGAMTDGWGQMPPV